MINNRSRSVGVCVCAYCGVSLTNTKTRHLPACPYYSPYSTNETRERQSGPEEAGIPSRQLSRELNMGEGPEEIRVIPVKRYSYPMTYDDGSGRPMNIPTHPLSSPFPHGLKKDSVRFARQGIMTVVTREYAEKNQVKGLFTDSANPCCIVILAAPEYSAMCHFDTATDMRPSFKELHKNFPPATMVTIIVMPFSNNEGPIVVADMAQKQILEAISQGLVNFSAESIRLIGAGNQILIAPPGSGAPDCDETGSRKIFQVGSGSALFWFDPLFVDPGVTQHHLETSRALLPGNIFDISGYGRRSLVQANPFNVDWQHNPY